MKLNWYWLGLIVASVATTGCHNLYSVRGVPNTGLRNGRLGDRELAHYSLAKPYIQITVYEQKIVGNPRYHFTAEAISVADPENRLSLIYNGSSLVDDGIRIKTGPGGLLERVAIRREPRAVEAVAEVARAVLNVAAPGGFGTKGDPLSPEFSRVIYQQMFPYTKGGDITNGLKIAGLSYKISCKPAYKSCNLDSAKSPGRCVVKTFSTNKAPHIYYRPLVPVTVTIERTPASDCPACPANPREETFQRMEQLVYLADPDHVERVDLMRAILAPMSWDFRFEGGTLVDARVMKRSDVMAVASLPAMILGSYTGALGNLFNVTVNHENEKNTVEGMVKSSDDGGKGDRPQVPRPPKE